MLFRRRPPKRIHHIELFLDAEVKDAVVGRFELCPDLDRSNALFEAKELTQNKRFTWYQQTCILGE